MSRLTRNGLPDLNDRGSSKWTANDLPGRQVERQAAQEAQVALEQKLAEWSVPGKIYDLLYTDCSEVKEAFPSAVIEDADDDGLHPGRRSVEIENVSQLDWLRFLIRKHFARSSFITHILMLTPSTSPVIKYLLDIERSGWRP